MEGGDDGGLGVTRPSPWDPLLISPWDGEGNGSRERGHVVVGEDGAATACMNPLRRCAPRPPFAPLRFAKRGGFARASPLCFARVSFVERRGYNRRALFFSGFPSARGIPAVATLLASFTLTLALSHRGRGDVVGDA